MKTQQSWDGGEVKWLNPDNGEAKARGRKIRGEVMVPNSHKIKIASNQNKPKQKQVDTLILTTKPCSKTWQKEETFRKSAPVAQKITQGKHGKDKDEGLQFQTQAY